MKYNKISKAILFFVFSIMLTGCADRQNAELFAAGELHQETETEVLETETRKQPETMSALIYVQVCGAVKNPGVVILPQGARVFEALEKAGGLTETADQRSVNQAELLSDGQQIVVWTVEEMKNRPSVPVTQTGESEEGKVNLNTATAEELMTLSGIGEAKAADIIAYREESGGFSNIEEIKNISGIKDAVFEKIRDRITVS